MLRLSDRDLELIQNKGISRETIENQIDHFKKGFPFTTLEAAATIRHGITQLNNEEVDKYADQYDRISKDYTVIKFVPASGAASRMFKFLFEFRDALNDSSFENLIAKDEFQEAKTFFDRLSEFAFYPDLAEIIKKQTYTTKTGFALACLNSLLEKEGLNYANSPKALLKFHKYQEGNRISLEEHLAEAAEYTKSKDGIAKLHFTVSPDYLDRFEDALNVSTKVYEQKHEVKYEISLSSQKPSTDTIAVDMHNSPLRDEENQLIFRPGGHGALIENLNELNADLVFIKNIDNVVTDDKRRTTSLYKKALGGMALSLQNEIYVHIHRLDDGYGFEDCTAFIEDRLGLTIKEDFDLLEPADKKEYLLGILNKPLRICGVVPNVGEPGGGPFWVNKNGETSLQIVESSEIDQNDPLQQQIMQEATHFNPVDLVCCTKDYLGKSFDLHQFIDHNAAFISEKSKDGKKLKAMELPGLWNGAMAFWNTLFVEVPLETFNPVKTVSDLLRPMHL